MTHPAGNPFSKWAFLEPPSAFALTSLTRSRRPVSGGMRGAMCFTLCWALPPSFPPGEPARGVGDVRAKVEWGRPPFVEPDRSLRQRGSLDSDRTGAFVGVGR